MNMMKLIVQDNVNAHVIALISRDKQRRISNNRSNEIAEFQILNFFFASKIFVAPFPHTQYIEHVILSNA